MFSFALGILDYLHPLSAAGTGTHANSVIVYDVSDGVLYS